MRNLVALLMSLPLFSLADDARWVSDSADTLNFKFGIMQPSLRFGTDSSVGNEDSPVDYSPGPLSKNFVSLSYRNLGAYLSWSNKQSADNVESYGDSRGVDFQLNFFGKKITQQYFYQAYQGYYISNTLAIDPSYPAPNYMHLPEMKTQHYGANFIYNFQPERYSMSVAYDQAGHQKESGGAWLAALGLHSHRFSSDGLLPVDVSADYGELANLQSGRLSQASLSGGGGYNWVFGKNWYMGGQLLFGYGWANQSFETAEAIYNRYASVVATSAIVGMGYNGEKHYFVIQGTTDSYTYSLPSMDLQITSNQSWVHYGYRFGGVDIPFLNPISAWLD
ncbi:DUF4421 family protein [Bdellovibrio sp. HCB337]|uniref:DUF4421 family protein n=1 Tax=Bdellovibrio sp. HCB337 TaxID=3394358 RepID=UPI0039A6CB66